MKISKIKLAIIAAVALFYSCNTGQIKLRKDNFSNQDILTMKLVHFPDTIFGAGQMEAIYLRDIDGKEDKPMYAQIQLKASVRYNFPNDDMQVKINGRIYNVKTSNVSGEIVTHIDANGSISQEKLFHATLHFTKEIEDALNHTDSIAYKFNLGADKPVIYTVKEDLVKKIQAFLAAKPTDQGIEEEKFF